MCEGRGGRGGCAGQTFWGDDRRGCSAVFRAISADGTGNRSAGGRAGAPARARGEVDAVAK